MKVGIVIIATNRYKEFVSQLISSINDLFLPDVDKDIILFSDVKVDESTIEIPPLKFPYATLKRYHIICENIERFERLDYIYYIDADSLIVKEVGEEILGDRVGVLHRSYIHKRGTYETNKLSTAYVGSDEGTSYFCGGFNGGSKDEYLKMAYTIMKNIDIDTSNNVMAIWHDESHLNRYFIDNPPTVVLDPSYMYPRGDSVPWEPVIYNLQAYKSYR